jgi:hypothetical protein
MRLYTEHEWNILIAKQGDTWHVTSLIDFGYAEVGPNRIRMGVCLSEYA